ncbi:hypothetical protein [Streptomyces sp. YIM B13518]|uniref:hypothetical protein n=1 Tax=Streptomyces sp. YIM B13518 TaxID=3366316 RepID=UPI003684D212
MEAVLRVRPVPGETPWSFLRRVAAAYRLQAGDLTGWWQWVHLAHQRRGPRPNGKVFLDSVAQAQLAGGGRVPAGHLARVLPSFIAGPEALAEYGGDEQDCAQWRTERNRTPHQLTRKAETTPHHPSGAVEVLSRP